MGLADGTGVGQMFWRPCEIHWKYLVSSAKTRVQAIELRLT